MTYTSTGIERLDNHVPRTQRALSLTGSELDQHIAHIDDPAESAQLAHDFSALAEIARRAFHEKRETSLALLGYAKAARRTGQLLGKVPRAGGERTDRTSLHRATRFQVVIAACQIERTTAYRWQQLAEVLPAAFDEWVARVEADEIEPLLWELLTKSKTQPTTGETPLAPPGTFSCITADPPWQYDNRATRAAATDHYPTLSVDQLCGREPLPGGNNMASDVVLPKLAPDAHLYLWTTSGFLRQAFDVIDAWGFTYKTSLVWVKPQMGIGNYFRSQHEFVLFGMRGHLGVQDGNQASWFQAKRGRHSVKPERFYELVETVSPGPYLELFGRPNMFGPRDGWTVWGNEA